MSLSDQDPSGLPDFSFNGEVASPSEVEAMERLAGLFLAGEQGFIFRSYGYQTESGAGIFFDSGVIDDENLQLDGVHVRITKNGYDDTFFTLAINGEGDLILDLDADDYGYKDVIDVLNEIRAEEDLNAMESQLLRHIENLALTGLFGDSLGSQFLKATREFEPEIDEATLASFIHQMIEQKGQLPCHLREFTPPDDDTLHILELNYGPEIDLVEIEEMPRLQVQVFDRASGIAYAYTRYQNGEAELITKTSFDHQLDAKHDDPDDDTPDIAQALGMYAPSKVDVEAVTKLLNRFLVPRPTFN